MIVFDRNIQDSLTRKNKSEVVLTAVAASRGIAAGQIICLHGRRRQFYRVNLENSASEKELDRFRVALERAKQQLENIKAQKIEIHKANNSSIFDAHLLILEDKSLISKIETIIISEKVNSEWAINKVIEDYITDYKAIPDPYLRERYIDLEDISDRLHTALAGNENSRISLKEKSVIVAKTLNPSALIELAGNQPLAVITEKGGWTSHTFILARELNLPAVTGLKGIMRLAETGDEAIVDGYNGKVILNPEKETVQHYNAQTVDFRGINAKKNEAVNLPVKTIDGREITIRANVDLPSGFSKAKQFGAKGIGLYRSEFLFNQHKNFPTEQEQFEAYEKIANLAGEDAVRIRTFDLNADQLVENSLEKELNPALGRRGIRLTLSHEKQFQIQLRAILRAASGKKIDIILPMISDVSEILKTKVLIEKEKRNLKRQKIEFGNPRIGVMVEVPAIVFMIDEVAREVDFLSLGTNDLVQYMLAVDRDNEAAADWFRTLHPAVLRSIKKIIVASENNKIPLLICGEMAGTPAYAAILIGLGATELSMNPNSILRVGKMLSSIAFEEATIIANQLLNCATTDSVEKLVSELFMKNWSHLFSPDDLPLNKK
jgi:phosphotransferase system enzyme I (PtsI)